MCCRKVFISGKKSEFYLQEMHYLGHIISKNYIKIDLEKLKVIEEWPQPKNLHELQSFIGMCAYYYRFIEKFSLIACPKKKIKFQWMDKEERAFKILKSKLLSESLLKFLDLSKGFEVHYCDAYGDNLGAILLKNCHPIVYWS